MFCIKYIVAKLMYKKKIVLERMVIAKSLFRIARGLMFASKKTIDKGICLEVPTKTNTRFNARVTMLFCFSSMDILFVNSNFKIVDKVTLKPFRFSYLPKKPCKYIIESVENKFEKLKVGDLVEIK